MNLHHSHEQPDWMEVPAGQWNMWQRLATATHGVITPGNVISSVGFVLVMIGSAAILQHHLIVGFWCIGVGRFADLADGFVADKTGTKSPLGEGVDAALDKIGLLGVLVALGAGHIVAWWILLLVAVQNGITTVVAYLARRSHVHIQPSASGKLGTGGMWLGFALAVLAAVYGHVWLWPAYGLLAVALVFNTVATVGYARPVVRRSV
jgi:phosphatidylglycerophosphate synthase